MGEVSLVMAKSVSTTEEFQILPLFSIGFKTRLKAEGSSEKADTPASARQKQNTLTPLSPKNTAQTAQFSKKSGIFRHDNQFNM
ncbi:hypothetical protein CYK00_02200 [Neisseria sicca]|uniref:Uncharacterized protein n=1 Tax=Neisseria sicca TaxID=490 RepID=A0A2I1XDY6_NEISI|nr:hypothetical protein [Neisseria sicca]PLA40850.1 hypothetical protein CYK00_02200 [Neisseria sicca]